MAPLPLGQFVAYSLNITRHALESFATLPDSRRFYQELENTTLPAGIRGLFYLATCNRVELYLEKDPQLSPALLEQRLLAIAQVFAQFLEQKPEQFVGTAALSHLIAVACGLESLALGETQIAGQIKRDMGYALAAGWLSPGLQIFLRKALETQKKVRSQTGISENAYSLMSLAEAAIAARGLLPLSGRMVLVGASEMSAKVARFALRRGAEHFMVVRKDPQKPMNGELAELVATRPQQFQIVSLEHFYAMADPYKANVLVAASSATRPLFSAHELKKLFTANVLKENAALIDLALPANFSTDAAGYFGRQYIGLGELKALSEKALAERRASAQQAAPIIRRAVYQFWLDTLYRENPQRVQKYLAERSKESESEWQRLSAEAALTEKQKRILYDFLKKEERRALASHRAMILDLIAGTLDGGEQSGG